MTTDSPKWQAPKPKRSAIQWLLNSDPSIRWQVMRDLTDTSDEEIAAERAVGRVRENVKWLMNITQDELPKDEDISWWHKPFFAGEVEPCLDAILLPRRMALRHSARTGLFTQRWRGTRPAHGRSHQNRCLPARCGRSLGAGNYAP
jgi:hypothetical protein